MQRIRHGGPSADGPGLQFEIRRCSQLHSLPDSASPGPPLASGRAGSERRHRSIRSLPELPHADILLYSRCPGTSGERLGGHMQANWPGAEQGWCASAATPAKEAQRAQLASALETIASSGASSGAFADEQVRASAGPAAGCEQGCCQLTAQHAVQC